MKKYVIVGTVVAAAGTIAAAIAYFRHLGDEIDSFFTYMANSGYDI